MPKKMVRDTKYGKSVSAYIILNKKKEHIATIQVCYTDYGSVMVDVFNRYELTYQGKAGGYGYDKFTAAISGATIDGMDITNHCERRWPVPKCGYFKKDFKRKGYRLTNNFCIHKPTGKPCDRVPIYDEDDPQKFLMWQYYIGVDSKPGDMWFNVTQWELKENPDKYKEVPEHETEYVYRDCYKTPGLDYLRDFGYTIIQAI